MTSVGKEGGCDRPPFRLTVQDIGGPSPAVHRLRSLLKAMLRAWGFRCLVVEDLAVKPPGPAAEKAAEERKPA
jgi:hypothetical protein